MARKKTSSNIECNCERADITSYSSKEFEGCECSLVVRLPAKIGSKTTRYGKIVKRSQIKSFKSNNMIVEWNTHKNEYGDYI
jgi:hypothetical protein